MEKAFSIVRQRYGLSPMNQMKNLDVNTAIWGTTCAEMITEMCGADLIVFRMN